MLRRTSGARVPVILQQSVTESGIACLAMILSYHGRHTTLEGCRDYFGTGRDGTTAAVIMEVARHFYVDVNSYELDSNALKHVQLPAIASWEKNHFVVVEEWTADHVTIVDPIGGRRKVDSAEFDASYQGSALILEPNSEFKTRSAPRSRPWQDYLAQMLRTPGAMRNFLPVLLATLLLQLISLGVPVVIMIIVDQVLDLDQTNWLTLIGGGIFVVMLFHLLFSYLRARWLIYLQANYDSESMMAFFSHVFSLPVDYFQRRTSGDMLLRLSNRMTISETFANQTLGTLLDGALVFTFLAVLLIWEPLFGILVAIIGILQVLLLLVTSPQMHALSDQMEQGQARSHSFLLESLSGYATLKASGSEQRAFSAWAQLFSKYMTVLIRQSHLTAVIETILGTLRVFAPILLLWIGAFFVINNRLTLGEMLALNAFGLAFLVPLSALVERWQSLQYVGTHLTRMEEVTSSAAEHARGLRQPAPSLTGRIAVRDVNFQYDRFGALVLRDINLEIEPGQKIAIVGHTGSGKSTLAALLLGLYQPTTGEILYDGLPLSGLDYRSMRQQMGVVLQGSTLFSTSIYQNIAFNSPGLPLERVRSAAGTAAIDDEILQMPTTYDTFLGENGSGLSGGQRQRIMIARALATDPAILMLDEATSQLDTVTENKINTNLAALEKTRILITHRLATVRDADLILVMQNGQIVERGRHSELMALKGAYTQLVDTQRSE